MEMNKNIILVAMIAVLVGGIGGYAIGLHTGGYGNHRMSGMYEKNEDKGGMHQMSDGRTMSNKDDSRPMMEHMNMMVESEQEFIEGMIPHHQEAIDTAKEVLARGGTTAEIRALAENIITAQEKEISDMKQWYQAWYGKEYQDTGTYEPMMRTLLTLNKEVLDKTFLEDMIHHHMGAIMMARSVEPHIEHPEMTNLTKAIIDSQTAEIELMRELLEDL